MVLQSRNAERELGAQPRGTGSKLVWTIPAGIVGHPTSGDATAAVALTEEISVAMRVKAKILARGREPKLCKWVTIGEPSAL